MGIAAALTAAAIVAPTAPVHASASAEAGATTTPTKFAFKASGFGTRVQGGQLPAGSDTTAFQAIGCTNKAGIDRENHEAAVDVPGLGTVSGVKTHLWTEQRNGVVSSYSKHSVANITLGDASTGSLEINAVSALARAYHDASGYHSRTRTEVASIIFTSPGGEPQALEIPTPDQPLEVPGLAIIRIGSSAKRVSDHAAFAGANAIDIRVVPSDTRARIAHSAATVSGGVTYGIFDGYSFGTRVKAVDDNVSSGPTPLSLMPCQGTREILRKKAVAFLRLGDNQVGARAVDTQQWSRGSRDDAEIVERGSIAEVDLGDGQLVINGIVGRAHAVLTRSGVTSDAKGTQVLEILYNGEEQHFPSTGVIEIPGLVRIEDSIIKRNRYGIKVTALRLTLLDGSGAVVNLGVAASYVRRSGL
jgi:hypothetical protein